MNPPSYEQLIRAVDLHDIALMQLTQRRAETAELDARTLQVDRTLTVELESFDRAHIKAKAMFALTARPKQGGDSVVDIQMTWSIRYRLAFDDGVAAPDRDLAEAFIKNNVVVNLWPYIRELVQTLTFRMGIPPLLLPMLKVVR